MKAFITLLLIGTIVSCSDSQLSSDSDDQARIEAEKKEQERRNILNYYLTISDSLHQEESIDDAIVYLDSALLFANTEFGELNFKKANYLFEKRDFELSAECYQTAIDKSFNSDTCHYQRALCFEKLRDRQSAVDELRKAIELNHEGAEKLHDRINPERKRVAYYVTRCCDGTTSNATGRGACSHHGGVCNWNDPVYETYRKY